MAADAWLVMVHIDPLTTHGKMEVFGQLVDAKHKGMGRVEIGWVRDDGQTPAEAARTFVDHLPDDERKRVETAKVARITEVVEVEL